MFVFLKEATASSGRYSRSEAIHQYWGILGVPHSYRKGHPGRPGGQANQITVLLYLDPYVIFVASYPASVHLCGTTE